MRQYWLIFALAALFFLPGCSREKSHPVTAIEVTLTDAAILPYEVKVVALTEISIQVTNQGSQPHGWYLLSRPLKKNETTPVPGIILYGVELAPGATHTGSFRSPSPGEYQVVSLVDLKAEPAMIALLTAFQPGYPP